MTKVLYVFQHFGINRQATIRLFPGEQKFSVWIGAIDGDPHEKREPQYFASEMGAVMYAQHELMIYAPMPREGEEPSWDELLESDNRAKYDPC